MHINEMHATNSDQIHKCVCIYIYVYYVFMLLANLPQKDNLSLSLIRFNTPRLVLYGLRCNQSVCLTCYEILLHVQPRGVLVEFLWRLIAYLLGTAALQIY